ncbi:uncharacterized protein LOC120654323 [Panicum virgatum]|uniref:uncharacterized protein LOC120654323 n=1 Tax=Panicum virgatum TaxID=38727 RepID=UPI0019D6209A|nr:uncharacterized protein LOC120654323 [Panicum virgatum]
MTIAPRTTPHSCAVTLHPRDHPVERGLKVVKEPQLRQFVRRSESSPLAAHRGAARLTPSPRSRLPAAAPSPSAPPAPVPGSPSPRRAWAPRCLPGILLQAGVSGGAGLRGGGAVGAGAQPHPGRGTRSPGASRGCCLRGGSWSSSLVDARFRSAADLATAADVEAEIRGRCAELEALVSDLSVRIYEAQAAAAYSSCREAAGLALRGVRPSATGLVPSEPPSPQGLEKSLLHFVHSLQEMPIAIETDKAKAQHYELPTTFFKLVLRRNLKYREGSRRLKLHGATTKL